MAGALDIARQKTLTTSNRPYIDWTNPLTSALIFCWCYPYGDLTGFTTKNASTPFLNGESQFGKAGFDSDVTRYEQWTLGKYVNGPNSVLIHGALKYTAASSSRYVSIAGSADDAAFSIYNNATNHRATVGGTPFLSAQFAATVVPSAAPRAKSTDIATWSGQGSSTSGTVTFYHNGDSVSTTGTCGTRGASFIEIGRYNSTYGQNSNSTFKLICVWNRALTAKECLALTAEPFAFLRNK